MGPHPHVRHSSSTVGQVTLSIHIVLFSSQVSNYGSNMLESLMMPPPLMTNGLSIPLMQSTCSNTMGHIGRKARVPGALCQNFKLSIAVHCRMRVVVVLPHTYFFFVPFFGHCENWNSDFIEMNTALATPALFATPNRSCSEGLKWQNWSHSQFAKSLRMTCLI